MFNPSPPKLFPIYMNFYVLLCTPNLAAATCCVYATMKPSNVLVTLVMIKCWHSFAWTSAQYRKMLVHAIP